MKPLIPAFLVSVTALAACEATTKAQTSKATPLTAQEQAFTEDYKALRAKHGEAAMRFALADVGGAPVVRGFSQPVFECEYEDGWLTGCNRVDQQ